VWTGTPPSRQKVCKVLETETLGLDFGSGFSVGVRGFGDCVSFGQGRFVKRGGFFLACGIAAPRISAVVYFDDEGAVWLNREVIPIAEVWEHRATS
jgi:hypothetical protein